ncbi:semaphorin-4G [Anguilla anguilla]|uniref:semaphorin-4G n=1 Tax=Anguilla anguilla TaxID=7936 RepID=UPI0015A8A266|nr:semaphorin-4G [Anguilla anguilla]
MACRASSQRPLLFLAFVTALWGFPFRPSLDLDVTPRITVFSNGLLGCRRFSGGALNYSTLLLEDGAGVLYVGARGAVFALDASDIAAPGNNLTIEWEASAEQKRQCLNKGKDNQTQCYNHIRFLQRYNETHLYVCGTHAFRPLCAYIDAEHFRFSSAFEEGREKCPYDPAKGYTGLLVDGEMYTASQYEFRSSPDIRRNIPYPIVKTEEAPTRWLLEADFVGSTLVRESINSSIGDDDKIYFFFTEKSQESTPYFSQTKVARVARVCKSDWGGQRTLQRKWTSFLKARLVCSVPDYDFHLNVLRSVFVVEGQSPQNTVFYGVFGLEWKNVKASAVCQYSIADVQKAFEGSYVESQDSSQKWAEYRGKVPEPRPGSCITNRFRAKGFNSSFDLPDDVLNFVRRHPLMFQQVRPRENRPLLFKRSVDYTKIAVHRVAALDGRPYDVLFVGTDEGWLHRAVQIGGQVHVIEELQLFEDPQPIDTMVISREQRSIYVGSASGVLQLPLSTCHRYASCFDCVFARDPFCGWDGSGCVEIASVTDRSSLTQDIVNGNRGCESDTGEDAVVHRTRSVMEGDDVLLQCELQSNLASPQWTLDGRELQGYGLNSGYRVGNDGLLIIGARVEQSGHYRCFAVENQVQVLAASYTITVRPDSPPPTPPSGAKRTTTTMKMNPPSSPTPLPPTSNPTEQPLPSPPSPPAPLPAGPEFQTYRNMEVMYISLVVILGGLCVVLSVVLLYVAFCVQGRRRGRKYSVQGLRLDRKRSSHMELKTVSSHCNGKREGPGARGSGDGGDGPDGLLQIVPGEGQASPNKDSSPPTPAPPLPQPPPLPTSEYVNGLSATLPSVLRKMNGNSYVLLRQADAETTSPLYHSFTEELNKILEKRKHNQLVTKPDESSV